MLKFRAQNTIANTQTLMMVFIMPTTSSYCASGPKVREGGLKKIIQTHHLKEMTMKKRSEETAVYTCRGQGMCVCVCARACARARVCYGLL
jgi:hypothetical protein